MRKRSLKALMLGGLMALSAVFGGSLAGCGSKGSATEFSWWLSSAEKENFYSDYADNPVSKYLLSKEWGEGEDKTALDFTYVTSGTDPQQNFNTLVSTNDLCDVMDLSYSTESSISLNEKRVAMDITDYVNQYMPNYKALIESDPTLYREAISIVNGQPRFLHLISIRDGIKNMYQGLMYRRDWIVKYGEKPTHVWAEDPMSDGTAPKYTSYSEAKAANDWTGWKTVENYGDGKFTANYGEDPENDYTDDVIFPSGNNEPIYISDWEWMFEIFVKAQEELNVDAKNRYCVSIYYLGTSSQGDFAASFGGGGPMIYLNSEKGEIHNGLLEDRTRYYVECMNTWYKKGWLDKNFASRSSDMFYQIDSENVRAGNIGAFTGSMSQLATAMDQGKTNKTDGIMVFGAKIPINDMYGTDEYKFTEPDTLYQFSRAGTKYMITTHAEGKNLPALFSFLDYMYTEEGGRLKSFGLSKEQYEEAQDSFYTKYGLTEGAYYTTEEDGKTVYRYAENNPDSEDLNGAAKFNRIPCGLEIVENVDTGISKIVQDAYDNWAYYENKGHVMVELMAKVPSERTDSFGLAYSGMLDYMSTNLPKLIKSGTTDSSWEKFKSDLRRTGVEDLTAILQEVYDLYNK